MGTSPSILSIPRQIFLGFLVILAFEGKSNAQPAGNCLIFDAPDCQGEPVLTANVLDEATCLTWLVPGSNLSVLWDPSGAAICYNLPELPIEMVSFEATVVDGTVHLVWTTASETDNAGFEIEHRALDGDFEQVGWVAGRGTSREAHRYRYAITELEPNRHVFRLKQVDFDGSFAYSSEVEALVTVPERYILEPPYPNPFNPSTTVRFAVAVEQTVTLTLRDAQGRQVALLFDGSVPANATQAVTIDANGLPSGSYWVTLRGRGFAKTVGLELVR